MHNFLTQESVSRLQIITRALCKHLCLCPGSPRLLRGQQSKGTWCFLILLPHQLWLSEGIPNITIFPLLPKFKVEKPPAAGKIVLICYLKHTQLPEPSDPRLSPKFQVCNLSTRISRAILASETTLSNLISKLLKSDLVSCSSSPPHAPLGASSHPEKLMNWTRYPSGQGSLTETDQERQKHTANVLLVSQGCSVIQKQNTVMWDTTKNNKLHRGKHSKITVGAHNFQHIS